MGKEITRTAKIRVYATPSNNKGLALSHVRVRQKDKHTKGEANELNKRRFLSLTFSRERCQERRAGTPEGGESCQPDASRVADPVGKPWPGDLVLGPPGSFQRLHDLFRGSRRVNADPRTRSCVNKNVFRSEETGGGEYVNQY